MAEQVVQSGRLGELPLIDLVVSACGLSHPSILRLERGGNTREFFFRDGELKALVVSNPAESLTAMLVRRKKMQAGLAETVREVAERDGIGEASAMMRDRMLPIPELVKEMNVWATLLMVSSFGWEQGRWTLILESVENAPPDTLLELHLPATLLRGVTKKLELNDIRDLLEPYFEDSPRRSPDAPFPAVAFDLDARQQALLDALDGQRTLRELVSFSPIAEEEALRLLYVLQRLGMLEFGAGDASGSFEDFGGLDDLDDDALFGASAPSLSQSLFGADEAAAEPEPEPAPPATSGGLDWGSIKFSRRESTERAGHYAATNTGKFERAEATGRTATVGVGIGHSPDEEDDLPPPAEPSTGGGLSGLFDGMTTSSEPSSRGIKPPRGGRGGGTWRGSDGGTTAESPLPDEPVAEAPPPPPADADKIPSATGLVIEEADWARMSTKDKDRVRTVVGQLNKMKTQNYFEYFGLTPEAPQGSIKKSFFKMARLYHPDSLVDEGDVYRAAAETLFGKFSEAYENLDDAELRDKYVRKHILGEKDEDDLALEKVQAILAAEGAFKDGLRRLNAGNLVGALKLFKEAVEGYDDEAEYVAYYGYTLFRARVASDPQEADRGIELIKKATELKPMANKPWHLLGKVYLQQQREDPSRAKKFLRKSLQINADDPECVRDYRRADELEKSGGSKKESKGGGLKGLFGKFGKKKDEPKKDDLDFKMEDIDFDF
jgi:curved DNA-binding protein CbpA